jgi:hypothetical protein
VADVLRLDRLGRLPRLRAVGCDYVAFGMEMINVTVAARMSKHRRGEVWAAANERAIAALSRSGIRVGVFVLSGLWETQDERLLQLLRLQEWRTPHAGQPEAIGRNWATLHPGGVPRRALANGGWPTLSDTDPATPLPDYLSWGTPPDSALLPLLVELSGGLSACLPTTKQSCRAKTTYLFSGRFT